MENEALIISVNYAFVVGKIKQLKTILYTFLPLTWFFEMSKEIGLQ